MTTTNPDPNSKSRTRQKETDLSEKYTLLYQSASTCSTSASPSIDDLIIDLRSHISHYTHLARTHTTPSFRESLAIQCSLQFDALATVLPGITAKSGQVKKLVGGFKEIWEASAGAEEERRIWTAMRVLVRRAARESHFLRAILKSLLEALAYGYDHDAERIQGEIHSILQAVFQSSPWACEWAPHLIGPVFNTASQQSPQHSVTFARQLLHVASYEPWLEDCILGSILHEILLYQGVVDANIDGKSDTERVALKKTLEVLQERAMKMAAMEIEGEGQPTGASDESDYEDYEDDQRPENDRSSKKRKADEMESGDEEEQELLQANGDSRLDESASLFDRLERLDGVMLVLLDYATPDEGEKICGKEDVESAHHHQKVLDTSSECKVATRSHSTVADTAKRRQRKLWDKLISFFQQRVLGQHMCRYLSFLPFTLCMENNEYTHELLTLFMDIGLDRYAIPLQAGGVPKQSPRLPFMDLRKNGMSASSAPGKKLSQLAWLVREIDGNPVALPLRLEVPPISKRISTTFYLAGTVARSTFISPAATWKVLVTLVRWLRLFSSVHEEACLAREELSRQSIHVGKSLPRQDKYVLREEEQAIFYCICQAVMHIWIYQNDRLMSMEDSKDMERDQRRKGLDHGQKIERLMDDFSSVLRNMRLNPLQICHGPTVQLFVQSVNELRLLFLLDLVEQNRRTMLPQAFQPSKFESWTLGSEMLSTAASKAAHYFSEVELITEARRPGAKPKLKGVTNNILSRTYQMLQTWFPNDPPRALAGLYEKVKPGMRLVSATVERMNEVVKAHPDLKDGGIICEVQFDGGVMERGKTVTKHVEKRRKVESR